MATLDSWPAKYPDEVLDYLFDWTDLLDGDALVGEPEAVALDSVGLAVDSITTAGNLSRLWVSGGTPSPTSRISLTAQTAGNRTIEYVVRLPIRNV